VLEGEFGRSEPVLRLEMVGVKPQARGHGTGQRLFDALAAWAQRHGIRELRTTAAWRDATMLHWLDGMGFELAPSLIVDCAVEDGPQPEEGEGDIALPTHTEHDFGSPEGNDFERRGRGGALVSTMTAADLREIVRIDRSITGRDRSRYIEGRLKEAMDDAAIRVSLTARLDGAIVGYLMARSDLGDFGRTSPVAVIDTLGVDSGYTRRGVGRAMLAQLFAHLGALQVERVEIPLPVGDLPMLGFFADAGFAPAQRLPFVRRLR
jgi:GNAT superfamily N-acetyltransferase